MHSQADGPRSRGFTLIELMIVVVIGSILLSIAIPSYMSQIRQSRRTEARTAILDLAGREERFFSTNSASYTAAPASLGYAGFGVANPVASGYYYLTVCSPACAPSAVPGPSYSVTATPVPGQSQAQDTQCQAFAVDSAGQQYAQDGTAAWTAAAQAFCWAN